MASTLRAYVAASKTYPRCLPGQPSGSEVALLRILSLEQLTAMVSAGKQKSHSSFLCSDYTAKQKDLVGALFTRMGEDRCWTLLNLALLEKRAAVMPDAFAAHCDALRASFSAFPVEQVRNLLKFRDSVSGWLDQMGSHLLDLILAPNSKLESVEYFLNYAKSIGFQFEESAAELLAQLQAGAGSRKDAYPLLVGKVGGTEMNETLKDFISNELRLGDPAQPAELYEVFSFLFEPEFPEVTEFRTGLYNYLTACSAKFGNSAALPQLLLNTLLQELATALARLILPFSVVFSFFKTFTTSARPIEILKLLEELSRSITRLAEFLALPHQPVFHRLAELFADKEPWSYRQCNRPWAGDMAYRETTTGALGVVHSGDLHRQLSNSDYHLCFRWGDVFPTNAVTLEQCRQSKIPFARLLDSVERELDNPLLEKILYSARALLAPTQLEQKSNDRETLDEADLWV